MATMPFHQYLAVEAVNWSLLKHGRDSARHLHHAMTHPTEDSTRLKLGRGAHTALFEPDRFALDYAVFTGERRAGKAWDEFCAANEGQTILKADEHGQCLAIAAAVRAHPVAGPMLDPPGEAEMVLTWTDEPTGLKCKARLDWYRPGLLCDLKTTGDIDRDRFASTAWRMGYHGQGAFYRRALEANGLDVPPFRIIAVEQTPPHDVAVFTLDDDAIYQGEQEVDELLRMVSAGRSSGRWPGRYQEEESLSLPRWALKDDGLGELGALVFGSHAAQGG